MSSNVINMFSSLKEIEMSRFRKGGFKRGVFNFEAIDPSAEIEDSKRENKILYQEGATDKELNDLSVLLSNIEIQKKVDDQSLTLYDRNGKTYNLYLRGRAQHI